MSQNIINTLNSGGVAVIPTDTLYGIVACANKEDAVKRIYDIKGRDENSPFIILVANNDQLESFGICLSDGDERSFIDMHWPGPVSVIFPCPVNDLEYLHRGGQTLAFRVPDDQALQEILLQTGPLVAPSANPAGKEPAHSIEKAKEYFGDKVDSYLDGGELKGEPSTLVSLENGEPNVLRGTLE